MDTIHDGHRSQALGSVLMALCLLGPVVGCGDNDRPEEEGGDEGALYALNSMVFDEDSTSTYVSLVESLDEPLDYDRAREFPGAADLWVHGDSVFVAESESLTITRFAVEDGDLVQTGRVGFAAYGLADIGFWLNVFVSPSKAYLLNGATEYIIWNPESMEIEGTVALPVLEERDGLMPFPGYSDRAARVRDGLLFQPLYWTDPTFFQFTPDSSIVVFDIEEDELVGVIEAPCPGLDFATADAAGNLYFTNWVYAAGGAAVLDQPGTCAAKIAAGDDQTASKDFLFADLTEGREGAAMRYIGDDRALVAVLHDDHAADTGMSALEDVTFGPNWRFWFHDLGDGSASMIEGIDWNAGAAYWSQVGDRLFMLVPAGDYSASTIYELGEGGAPEPILDTLGWSFRLFQLR